MTSHDELLTAAAQGDDKALAFLVRAHHDHVYHFGQRVCPCLRDGTYAGPPSASAERGRS